MAWYVCYFKSIWDVPSHMLPDPTNYTNTQELQQYCGSYVNGSGIVVPYLLKDGTEAPWSKGFTCENGLICEVKDKKVIIDSSIA